MPNPEDYLIEQSGKDWTKLLSGWSPPLPTKFTVWFVNRIGDVIVVFEDESVHFLDVGIGIIKRIADSREDFFIKIDQDDNANNWLAIKLIDECVAHRMILGPHQCYGFKVPPILDGEYQIDNLVPTDLAAHYSFLADIYKQTCEIPDGTEIRVVVKK